MTETAIIYVRVSTDDHDQSPERQVPDCRRYCEDHNLDVLEVVKEHVSGSTDPWTRPKLSQALEEHRPRHIVFQELDRWSRQHPQKVLKNFKEAKKRGVKLVSATQPMFNMDSEQGDLLLYIAGWFNNWYLKQMKKKIKSGMEQARREGKSIGRPTAKFNKHRAFHLLYNEGKSCAEVAEEVNASKTTVWRFKKGVEKNPESYIKELGVS